MAGMTQTASLTPADRFTSLVERLMKDVEASVIFSEWVPIWAIKLLWRRLRRMKARFAAVVARLRAGGPMAGVLRARRERRGAADPDAARRCGLPVHCGWLLHTISWAFVRAWDLEEIVADPEMERLVAAAPELGRVLRPLCHMLAVKQPAYLRLPRWRGGFAASEAAEAARLPEVICLGDGAGSGASGAVLVGGEGVVEAAEPAAEAGPAAGICVGDGERWSASRAAVPVGEAAAVGDRKNRG